MKRPLKIRAAHEGDITKIVSLHQKIFESTREASHHRWKFLNNPVGSQCIVVAETEEGDIVGQYALWPVMLQLGKQQCLGAQSLDTMIHPDFRNQGLFMILANACYKLAADQGVKVLYGFPNENSYRGFIRKLNWDHTGDISHLMRPIYPGFSSRIPRWLSPVTNIASRFFPCGTAKGYEISLEIPADEELEQLFAMSKKYKGLCRVARSSDWVRWRFAEESGQDYQWVVARKGNSILAACVIGRSLVNNNLTLSELLGENLGALQAVLSVTIKRAFAAKAPFIHTLTSIPEYLLALRRVGFVRVRSVPFIVRGLSGELLDANIHTHDSWRIFGADVDTM